MTPWTVAYQAPLSMGFFRQEYLSGVPFTSPKDLPDPGIKPRSPAWKRDSLPAELPGKPETFYGFLQILHPGVGGGRREQTQLLHKFTTYLHKFMNKENEPI